MSSVLSFQIDNITDPLSPSTPVTTSTADATKVCIHGNYAYTAMDSNGVSVYAISNPARFDFHPAHPSRVKTFDTKGFLLILFF